MGAPIAVQLYSVRGAARADLAGVLARLSAMGFAGVEPAGLHGRKPAAFRRLVEGAGLRVCGVHAPLPEDGDLDAVLDGHAELGCDTWIVPLAPAERFRDEASIGALAEALDHARARASARGMRVGYHNHWWELAARVGGRPALDHLFARLDPGVLAEVDVYWARVGGADPAGLVAALGPRVRLLHLKDGPADGPGSPMTAVGEGALDIPAVLAAARDLEWGIVEIDHCAGDVLDALERSVRYLLRCGLGGDGR